MNQTHSQSLKSAPIADMCSTDIQTCGDVWEHRVMLFATLGITDLLNAYLGLGSTVVQPGKREERKSVGRESTFRPTNNETELYGTLRKMADQVERDLERLDFRGKIAKFLASSARFFFYFLTSIWPLPSSRPYCQPRSEERYLSALHACQNNARLHLESRRSVQHHKQPPRSRRSNYAPSHRRSRDRPQGYASTG